MWKLWGNLEDAVREGTHRWHQAFGWDGPIFSHFFRTDEALREFLMGMHGFGLISSPHVVAAFDLGRFRHLVDLGGATGHLAIAACQRYPDLRATVFDLPEAQPLAREIVGAVAGRGSDPARAGDFFTDPLPAGDLYALGRILHDWTEEKILPASRPHPRRVTAGRSRPDRREARCTTTDGPRRGADAEPEHADLHRGQGTDARGVRGLAPRGRVRRRSGRPDAIAARCRHGGQALKKEPATLSVIEDPASVRDPLEGAGFVIVPEVVTRGQVSELIEETRVCSDARGEGVLRRGDEVYGVRDLIGRVPAVRRLAGSPEILRWIRPVLGPRAFVVRACSSTRRRPRTGTSPGTRT